MPETEDKKKLDTGAAPEEKKTETKQEPETKGNDLSGLVEEFVSELPEEMRGLIPDSLSDVEKIKLARGLAKTAVKKAAAEDGPGSETPGRKQAPDYNSMTTSELLNAGLK